MKINIAELFVNKNRVNLIKKICGEKSGNHVEKILLDALDNIPDSIDENTFKLINFIAKLDNISDLVNVNLPAYSLKNKKVHIIKNEEDLNKAALKLNDSSILGFDTEQKPIFKKGVPPSKIAIIQISNETDCYLFQVHLIKNIQAVLNILTNPSIVKVGIGLNGDNAALYKEFRIRIKSCIDFGALFKSQMMFPNDIGAKNSVLLFLNQNLQKSKKVSRSNWENIDLSESQVKYASEDASCVYDVFIAMLSDYPFLIKILPFWFEDKYKEEHFTKN